MRRIGERKIKRNRKWRRCWRSKRIGKRSEIEKEEDEGIKNRSIEKKTRSERERGGELEEGKRREEESEIGTRLRRKKREENVHSERK